MLTNLQEEERKGGKKGRLLGVITLSDVLRYIIGEPAIGEGVEPPEGDNVAAPPAQVPTPAPEDTS